MPCHRCSLIRCKLYGLVHGLKYVDLSCFYGCEYRDKKGQARCIQLDGTLRSFFKKLLTDKVK